MKSVFAKHGDEIRMYQEREGTINGLLSYAISILSDVQEIVGNQYADHDLNEEINEVKELILEAIKMNRNVVLHNHVWFARDAMQRGVKTIRTAIEEIDKLNIGVARDLLVDLEGYLDREADKLWINVKEKYEFEGGE